MNAFTPFRFISSFTPISHVPVLRSRYPAYTERKQVQLVSVLWRDGIQWGHPYFPTNEKVKGIWYEKQAGFTHIEIPTQGRSRLIQWVDAANVSNKLEFLDGTNYWPLVTTIEGVRDATSPTIALFVAASESFNRENNNCSIDEWFVRAKPMIDLALQMDKEILLYISCCWGCPIEGGVPFEQVRRIVEKGKAMGCHRFGLSDSMGSAIPETIEQLIRHVATTISIESIDIHLHGKGLRVLHNAEAAVKEGCTRLHVSKGKRGGCPVSRKRGYEAYNLDQDELINHFQALNIDCGISAEGARRSDQFFLKSLAKAQNAAPPAKIAAQDILYL